MHPSLEHLLHNKSQRYHIGFSRRPTPMNHQQFKYIYIYIQTKTAHPMPRCAIEPCNRTPHTQKHTNTAPKCIRLNIYMCGTRNEVGCTLPTPIHPTSVLPMLLAMYASRCLSLSLPLFFYVCTFILHVFQLCAHIQY